MLPDTPQKKSSRRKVILLAAVAVVILASVLIPVILMLTAQPYLRMNNTTVSREVYCYWLTWYKYEYLVLYKADGAADTEEFWNSTDPDTGLTHLEQATSGALDYMRQVVAAAAYLDSTGRTLTDTERDQITLALNRMLTHQSDGSKSAFNRLVEPYGFDYRAVKEAVLLEAKANKLYELLAGDVSSVSDAHIRSYVAENYTHTLILIVNTDIAYLTDEDGTLMSDGKGGYQSRPLTEEEKAEKQQVIADIEQQLTAGIDEAAFRELMREHNDDLNTLTYRNGYFFAPSSAFTTFLLTEEPDVTRTALELEEDGDWKKVTTEGGMTAFVYRAQLLVEDKPWDEDYNYDFFSDVRSLTALYLYKALLKEQTEAVEVFTERVNSIDFIALPYQYAFRIES